MEVTKKGYIRMFLGGDRTALYPSAHKMVLELGKEERSGLDSVQFGKEPVIVSQPQVGCQDQPWKGVSIFNSVMLYV